MPMKQIFVGNLCFSYDLFINSLYLRRNVMTFIQLTSTNFSTLQFSLYFYRTFLDSRMLNIILSGYVLINFDFYCCPTRLLNFDTMESFPKFSEGSLSLSPLLSVSHFVLLRPLFLRWSYNRPVRGRSLNGFQRLDYFLHISIFRNK